MWMKRVPLFAGILSLFLLVPLTFLFGQDHAPTVEQCRADQRAWSADFKGNQQIIDRLTYYQLSDRMSEMADCVAVDPDRDIAYGQTANRFFMKQMVRLRDFVKRQGLYDQFIAEDAAGKR